MLIILVKEKDQLEPKKKTILPEKEGIDKYKPRYLVSSENFVVNTPGQLPTGYGQKYYSSHFHGGTLYNDAADGIIWVENQVSLGASETFLGKEFVEK